MKRVWWAMALIPFLLVPLSGCGRHHPPWEKTPKANITMFPTPKDRPSKDFLEWGPEDAKVRIIGFFYISKADPRSEKTMELLEGLTKQYPGKVYAKYWDLRTRAGLAARSITGKSGSNLGLVIDGKSEVKVQGEKQYTVDFNQEMGRYWTEDDLKTVVAQEVKEKYGPS